MPEDRHCQTKEREKALAQFLSSTLEATAKKAAARARRSQSGVPGSAHSDPNRDLSQGPQPNGPSNL